MSRSLKDQTLDPLQKSEPSDPGPVTVSLPDPGSPAIPLPPATEYEVVGGIDQNLREPDTESTNAGSEMLHAETAWELGDPGMDMGGAGETALLDAIYGSYPELMDQAIQLDGVFQEVVIGPDNRVRVQNTTVFPWRAICGLRIQAANGQNFIGTGWLISPRTVITAGHCVFLHDAGGWARSITVIPGLNGAARPFGTHTSSTLRSVTGWTQSRNRNFDYGAIILPPGNRPGAQTGTFGFAARNDAFLKAAALNLSGYPGDKGGSQQWFHAQKAKSVSERVITYEIDTAGGQSGSPVWVLQNGVRTAVGIHTNGASSGNSATRIVAPVFNNLQNWKNQGA